MVTQHEMVFLFLSAKATSWCQLPRPIPPREGLLQVRLSALRLGPDDVSTAGLCANVAMPNRQLCMQILFLSYGRSRDKTSQHERGRVGRNVWVSPKEVLEASSL